MSLARSLSRPLARSLANSIAPSEGGGVILPTGLVADGARRMLTTTIASPYTGYMSRQTFVASTNITSLQLCYANFRTINTNAENGVTSGLDIRVSVEYPSGTFTPVYFSGSRDGTIPSNEIGLSDSLSISIPAGATFWVRTLQTDGTYILFTTYDRTGNWAKITTTDETLTDNGEGTVGYSFGPFAIIGPTAGPSIWLAGDSIMEGDGDSGIGPHKGAVAPSLGDGAPYLNLGISGEYVYNYRTTLRTSVQEFCETYMDTLVSNFGTNSLGSAASTPAVIGYIETFLANYPDMKRVLCTLIPRTTSTDSWATDANQTVYYTGGTGTGYDQINSAIRAVSISGQDDFLEIHNALVSGTAANKWVNDGSTANLYTADGVHPTAAGYARIVTEATIDVTKLGLAA